MAEELTYMSITEEFIINWCKENKQIAWLKAVIEQPVKRTIYAEKQVEVTNENGETEYKTEKDKKNIIGYKEEPMSFIDLKNVFVKQFMPELLNKEPKKKETFRDRIRAL